MTLAHESDLESALAQEFEELGEEELQDGSEGEAFLGALSGLGSLASGLGKLGSVASGLGKLGSVAGSIGKLGSGAGKLGSLAGGLGKVKLFCTASPLVVTEQPPWPVCSETEPGTSTARPSMAERMELESYRAGSPVKAQSRPKPGWSDSRPGVCLISRIVS